MQPLAVQYSPGLVLASILISIISAYAAFSLADRTQRAGTKSLRRWWTLFGSCALGIGIWSMHFLGMLALQLPVVIFYFLPTVILSLVLAVGASAVVLTVVSGETLGWKRLAGAGLLMGAGIGAMHYTGMSAMRGQMMHHYTTGVVVLSLAVAWGFSTLALWIGFAVRHRSKQSEWTRISAGTVMGLGIAAMHYTAMAGMRYTADKMTMPLPEWTMHRSALGGAAVAVTTLFILVTALGTAAVDKRRFVELEIAQEALLETEQQLREANALLSELAIRDALTGLFNRRHFDAVFDTELRRAARAQLPLALLMIDVDYFKALNDVYGHQYGDNCLREIARTLEELPRRSHDFVARYGGEEFVAVLPGANAEAAIKIAETMRKAVLDLEMEHAGSSACRFVTVSIGVCSRKPEIGETTERMLGDADTALYVAKEMGRNRVVASGGLGVGAEKVL
jgi:diguanylate cyclase (GGDEF)-like protein